ncbi:MAG: SpoIID/LytB domain-containing protein [Candidatus Aminicenantes bacterium]|nr:SpoIID/LytB domain-containing protein [Candidatus Aminicenantes bacterium]
MSIRHFKHFFTIFAALFFIGGRPVEFGRENTFFHGFPMAQPVISIGLGTNLTDILIRSSSGMKVYEVGSEYALISDDAEEALVKGHRERLTEKFLLLVAQTKEREEADNLAAGLRARVDGRFFVDETPASDLQGVFQVKVGDFLTRGDALAFQKKLGDLGVRDTWILREVITEEESKPAWVLIDNELKSVHQGAMLYFIPGQPESFLSYNDRSYRGIFVLRPTSKGVVLVNVLNLEDYLKGVVPGEMSPDQYAEIEALKAQAVAARTYALKNIGQFKALGYDLVDTPRSQVYFGLGAERPLSSRAVDETKGEVAKYAGRLINALYTSTCGGQTEAVEDVFEGSPSPYLKSVECTYEKQPEWSVESRFILPLMTAGSRDVTAEAGALIALGVLPPAGVDYATEAAGEEAAAWLRAALAVLKMKDDGVLEIGPGPVSFLAMARLFVAALHWQDHVDHLLLPSEANFVLRRFPQVTGQARNSLAYGIQSGLIPFSAETDNPNRHVTRAEFATALYRLIFSRLDPREDGVFRKAGPGSIEVTVGTERRTLKLGPEAVLLRDIGGRSAPASRLTFLGGEHVRWLVRDDEVRLLEAFVLTGSHVLDRSSPFNRWQVRKTREELAATLNGHVPVGELFDLNVRRRGASGRVTELEITGTAGKFVVRGLKVRWALGLRDTLFALDREFDADGKPAAFTFTGRGWGHGVGLCQVGAYGMALAGADYRTILKKYYPGVKVDKLG